MTDARMTDARMTDARMTDVRAVYRRHFANDPRRERGFLSAAGFTTAFATARAITHSIRAVVGPFRNISAGGTHIHHTRAASFTVSGPGLAAAASSPASRSGSP